MFLSIVLLACAGFGVSLYAYFVERKIMADANYKAACDLTDRISCTKPLTSQYAKLFFISNSLAGMIFYTLVALLGFYEAPNFLLLFASAGLLSSIVLGYLLYFKVKALCLLCTSLYIINICLFVISYNVWKL